MMAVTWRLQLERLTRECNMQRIVQEGVEYLYHEHERVEIRILCLRDVIINVWKPEARQTE